MEHSGRRRPPLPCWDVDHQRGAGGDTGPNTGDGAGRSPARRSYPAPYAMLAGFAGLLAIGTAAAALHGRLPPAGVLAASAVLVAVVSLLAEAAAAPAMAVMGWLTTAGFSGPPYAQLRLTGPRAGAAAAVMSGVALACAGARLAFRMRAERRRLWTMGTQTPRQAGRGIAAARLASAIGGRRLLTGIGIGAAALPAVTAVLVVA